MKSTPDAATRYDAHCHIFSLEYLLLEAASIAYHMLRGDYPRSETSHVETDKSSNGGGLSDVRALLEWIRETWKASTGNEATNLDMVRGEVLSRWKTQDATVVPLMMDIFFLFAPVLGAGETARSTFRIAGADDSAPDHRRIVAGVLDLLDGTGFGPDLQAAVRGALDARWADETKNDIDSRGYFESAGFVEHRDRLVELKGSRGSQLFPFFAVDPRRQGVVDAVLAGGIVGPGGPFHGVKLYPRLGYHPACADLMRLYEWCDRYRIPIVTHCGPTGFPPAPLECHPELGDPANFAPVLEKYPTLAIDFAHFGSSDADWARRILGYLTPDHPNVYSDLACFTEEQRIVDFKADFWQYPEVRARTMFGTDFDVFYFTEPETTLAGYYAMFDRRFTDSELRAMTSTLPAAFLFGDASHR